MTSSKKPIRWSTWHVFDKKSKTNHIVEKVLVTGGIDYLRVISKSPVYLNRVYDEVYGGKTRNKAFEEKRLLVKRIVIQDLPDFGNGVGCLDNEAMSKCG